MCVGTDKFILGSVFDGFNKGDIAVNVRDDKQVGETTTERKRETNGLISM